MKRAGRSRAFLLSFTLTMVVFGSTLIALSLLRPGTQVIHLPKQVGPYSTVWARYVPGDAIYAGFENLTLAHSINSSIPANQRVVEVLGPNVFIQSSDLKAVLTITYSSPNATADILFLKSTPFEDFTRAIKQGGSLQASVGNASLYYVASRVGNQTTSGWMAIAPGDMMVALSDGTASAKAALVESLGVAGGSISSIITRLDVDQMLYIAGGADNHTAIAIENFPGVVRTGQMTLVSVDYLQDSVYVYYIVKFSSQDQATSQIDAVMSSYINAREFAIYDSYVKATVVQAGSSLEKAMRLVL